MQPFYTPSGSPPFLTFEASLPAMEEAAVNQQTDMPYTAPRHREHDPMDDSTQPPPASTSHSEARNLLLLQDYVRNVSQAQLMLEQTSASLQRTEILTGIFSEHDLRTLRTACQCLNSLCIRVEARANTVEPAMIEQQLQFMQSRVQSPPKTSAQMTLAALPEPMPTILCRKTILTDHLEYEHFGATLLRPVDNLFDEHYGAIKMRMIGKALLSGF